MRILVPSLGFSRAGGSRVLSELANHWMDAGHHVDFLVNESTPAPYFPTRAGIFRITQLGRLSGGEPSQRKSPRGPRAHANLISLYLGLSKIGRSYDVVLANHSLTAWPTALAHCGRARKFYYVQAYEPEVFSVESGLKAKVLAWISSLSYGLDLIQVCNAPLYLGYKEIRAREWVPPGIDFRLFFPKATHKDLGVASEVVLGCIGRRERTKGIRFVLEAFEALWAEDRRYRLRVAFGNLPEGWSHPGAEVVVPRNDEELASYYRSLDVIVAPGLVQLGAPHYPVMEGMACGIPVVTTGYLPADERNAWIVPVGDSAAIARTVREIARSGSATREKVALARKEIEPFGWKQASEKFIELFSRA